MSTPPDLEQSLARSGKPFGRPSRPGLLLQGLLPLQRGQLRRDMLAGCTLAALAIPEVIGYARIAGMPVVAGLYTLLLPAILFALFGSSRRLVVGADSATAAIMASSLVGLAAPGTPEWLRLALLLALGCAGLLLVAQLARLAFLADFLSRTVLAGFLTGVGLQVALGEVPGMLGLQAHGPNALARLADTLRQWTALRPHELAIAAVVLAVVLALRRLAPRWPGALLAVAGSIVASLWCDWGEQGVALVGALHGGLPGLALPDLALARAHAQALVPTVLAMGMVILAQSAATARADAWKHDEQFDEGRDLTGLALANAGAALSGAFVVNGSPTKTQMVESAGGNSQAAHLTMAAVVTGVLLFATGPIGALPLAALSAIVFLIGLDLLHLRELVRIRRERPSEFWIALATAASVLATGVEQAIVLAMVLSLIDHVRRGYRPRNSLVVRGADGHGQLVPVDTGGAYAPGLLIYRFSHAMYYANAELLSREVTALATAAQPQLRWFVIDLDAVDDIDYSAGATLLGLRDLLQARGIALHFLRASAHLQPLLTRYGIVQDGGAGTCWASLRALRHGYEAAVAPH